MAISTGNALAQRTYEIGVLVDYKNDEFIPIFDQLRSEIVAVVGSDANIVFSKQGILANNFDIKLARRQYQELQKSSVDIILAFGPINNEVIVNQKSYPKPTILFGAVNTDVVDIDAAKRVSGIRNFTYILLSNSYRKDMLDFRTIFPFERVGVIGAYGPWDTVETRDVLDSVFAEIGAEYELLTYESPQQLEQELENVDSVYMAEGFGILRAEVKELADIFIRKKLPSFTNTATSDVRDGWLATNQSDSSFERLFRRIALSVDAVVNGENLSQRPVYIDLGEVITLNYNTAEKIGVALRFSQIATTDVVGSFDDFVVDQTLTVLDAVEIALKNNLTLSSSALDVDLAAENVASARTNYLPDLSLSASGRYVDPDLARLSGGQNPEETVSGSIGVSQTLYSEDASAAIGIQRSLLLAEKENYNTDVLDTVLTTTRACFNLLRLKNALQSQSENLEITKRNLNVAKLNFDAGQSSKADIFRFQSEMATNTQSLIDALNSFQQGQHALNRILNNPIDTRVAVEEVELENGPFEPEEFSYRRLSAIMDDPSESIILENYLIDIAFESSPELAALSHNQAASERDIKQYGWRRYIPTVSASAQYNNVFDRSGVGVPDPNLALDDDYNLGLMFSVPLFNRNSDNVKLRVARKQLEQLEIQMANQAQQIETRVRDSMLDLSGRIANIELSAVAEKAALQGLQLIEASYANGAVTITELIDSQNNYLQAQLGSSNALYNFLESAVSLERAVGNFIFLDNFSLHNREFIEGYEAYRIQHGNRKAGAK
jgi:outer membrane protein TolC